MTAPINVYTIDYMLFTNAKAKDEVVYQIIDTLAKNKPDLVSIAPHLYGQQIDAQQRLEQHWGDIQDFTTQFLSWAGADPVAAEEIMALPGMTRSRHGSSFMAANAGEVAPSFHGRVCP